MCKKIKLHLNLGELRQIQDARLLRTGIYLAKAEVHAMSCALDSNSVRSKALFDSDPEHYEYAVVTKFANGVATCFCFHAKDLIGLADGDIKAWAKDTSFLYYYTLYGKYEVGQIIYFSRSKEQCTRAYAEYFLAQQFFINLEEKTKVLEEMKKHLPKTKDGWLLPMLGLLAIKLSAINGRPYSVEAAADTLYGLGFIAEPDFSQDSLPPVNLDGDKMSPTIPGKVPHEKYNTGYSNQSWGKNGETISFALAKGIADTFFPIAFIKVEGCSTAITLPCPQTRQLILLGLYCVYAAEGAIVLTEYPSVTASNQYYGIPVVSFPGGEDNVKFVDMKPLSDKPVTYLVIAADGEETTERAYRVMLKAFARAYRCGNRRFEALVWETDEIVPFEQLYTQAVEKGYLEQDLTQLDLQEIMSGILRWMDKTPGLVLFGRAFQSGRIHLVVASRGIGKTQMMLLYAVMACTGKSIDNAFFENHCGKPIRVLYVQSEMNVEADFKNDRLPAAERLIEKNTNEALVKSDIPTIDFYQVKNSLVNVDEQIALLKRLAELDPNGFYQWVLVIDSLRTEMPEVLNGGNIFKDKVFPMLDFLRKKGIAIALLHHENQEGNISGPGTIQDLADMVVHIVPSDKKTAAGETDVNIIQEKKRLLKGRQQATAHWNWVTDEEGIVRFHSEYLDDSADSNTPSLPEHVEQPQDAPAPAPAPVENADERLAIPNLPKTRDELNAVPDGQKQVVLFELWRSHITHSNIAKALDCGGSTIASLMKEYNVNKKTYKAYLSRQIGEQ